MACSRCGTKLSFVPPRKVLEKTIPVSAKASKTFARVSTMERFLAAMPQGDYLLEPGKVYIFSEPQINDLKKAGAPIWILK